MKEKQASGGGSLILVILACVSGCHFGGIFQNVHRAFGLFWVDGVTSCQEDCSTRLD